MKLRFDVSVAMLLISITTTNAQSIGRYLCSAENVSVHSFGQGSFQNKLNKGQDDFPMEITKIAKNTDVRCDDEIKTLFNSAYCQMRFKLTARGIDFYGEEFNIYRGYQPWNYFILFDDGVFAMSTGASSLNIATGKCAAVGK